MDRVLVGPKGETITTSGINTNKKLVDPLNNPVKAAMQKMTLPEFKPSTAPGQALKTAIQDFKANNPPGSVKAIVQEFRPGNKPKRSGSQEVIKPSLTSTFNIKQVTESVKQPPEVLAPTEMRGTISLNAKSENLARVALIPSLGIPDPLKRTDLLKLGTTELTKPKLPIMMLNRELLEKR